MGRDRTTRAAHPAAVRASAWLHVASAGTVAVAPHLWPWVLGALVADHLALLAGGLWPRSGWIGPNLRRLEPGAAGEGAVALTFDDGPDPETTPEVLRILAAAGARASFFCVGRRVERHPDLAARIVESGHRIENHTHTHPNSFFFRGPRAMGREIDRAQETIRAACGDRPAWFRAPAGIRNPLLAAVLARRGLGLVSWTRRAFDTVDGDASRVRRRLASRPSAGDVLVLHDRGGARDRAGRPVVLAALPGVLDDLAGRGLRAIALPRPEPAARGSDPR